MKMLNPVEIQNEAGKERGIRFAIAVFLVLTWAIIFLIPQGFIYAQSISILPGMTSDSRASVSRELNSERASAPSPSISKAVTEKRAEGPLQKSLVDVRSQHLRSQVSSAPKEAVSDSVLIPRKLDVLSRALINQNIKGLAGLKLDEFTGAYLAAIGVDLFSGIENHKNEKYFAEIFKIKGPWVVMRLAVSPTSMHEFMGDFELSSAVGDILEANKLPSNLSIERQGKNVIVEAIGSENLFITFCVNEKDEVTVVIEK